ncbi:MAG: cytidine/deoxycytidylate deaminase family protein [archaeon]|nr:cytidine/deoxycytidylate deaminase family protein [archaeon]
MQSRPSWDEYFLEMLEPISKRSTCDRAKTSCLIVKDKHILCSGYAGSPPGLDHCDDVGHLMKKVVDEDGTINQHCVRTIHSEQNAITQAAKHGISLDGSTLYAKMEPCRVCAMLIISVGIKRVVCQRQYHAAQETREMFQKSGVQLEVIENQLEQYPNQ